MMEDYSRSEPSEYNGNYYESKTEARWAAYFDYVGMPFIYEPESFIFRCRDLFIHKYTPDFYLPEQNTYAEVKYGNINNSAIDKILYLARFTGKTCLLLNRPPKYGHIYVYSPHDNTPEVAPTRQYSCDYEFQSDPCYENSWRAEVNAEPTLSNIINGAVEFTESAITKNITQEMYDYSKNRKSLLWKNPAIFDLSE